MPILLLATSRRLLRGLRLTEEKRSVSSRHFTHVRGLLIYIPGSIHYTGGRPREDRHSDREPSQD